MLFYLSTVLNRKTCCIYPIWERGFTAIHLRMQILDGNLVARATKDDLAGKVQQRMKEGKKVPHLAAILVGADGASETYVASKVKTCELIGFRSTLIRLPDSIAAASLLEHIAGLNKDPDVDGILVQLPLPKHITEEVVINAVLPSKDVDGFHPVNAGRMMQGFPSFLPATPYGVILLLEHYGIETKGKQAVVIGRSNIVGRPMSILLSNNSKTGNCTVTLCHSHTKNLKELCLNADIVVAALGKPEFVRGDMIREGAIVIDVGISRVADNTKKKGYALKGDVDFGTVAPKCSYITPVPGGVGPMTIAALMMNTYQACIWREESIK